MHQPDQQRQQVDADRGERRWTKEEQPHRRKGLRSSSMSASAWVITWVLLSQPVFCWSQHQRNISAGAGQTVTLPCQYPDNNTISVVGWSRTDLGEEYVLLYRDEAIDKSYQKPSYWDRVDLQNRLMPDGNVSLVLRDVRTYDSGTYECRVVHSGLSEAKLGNGPICTIHLDVAPPPPGNKDGDTEDGDYEDKEDQDEENQDKGNKNERNKEGGNKHEENVEEVIEGSIFSPIFFMFIITAVAFLIVRGRCLRLQFLRDRILKRKLLP
ncbi:uncharacterized protein LOC105923185 isoform X2 [Fundulus heteroclitus]|uniref:uncharacterized protein LOC105923185 isoform X2 n=1 Tax=Fundulus heteroclitus TaxID=8078 RepID=UPI00165A3CA2|nr:uncharacterized protein LOC105923185 isoform X2 [Fundulus heteroclitus]